MEEKCALLEELYQKEYEHLYEMAYNELHDEYDAEDVVTEVIMTIMQHKIWWEKQNEQVRTQYAIKTCEKVCKEFCIKRNKISKVEFKEDKSKKGMDVEFEKKLLEQENLMALFECLKETDKDIFTARYIEGQSIKTIAGRYKTSENNISKRLSRGRKVIKEYLATVLQDDKK